MAPTSGPRPLRLAFSSNITSQVLSSSPNASDSPTHTEQKESEDAHQISLYTPPSSAREKGRSSSRRHSSISYIRSGTGSPLHASFQRESVDVFMKSPRSESPPKTSQYPPVRQLRSPGLFLSRNKSLSGPIERKKTSDTISHGLPTEESKFVDALKHLKERPPVTLADKHAELLHFIAQKESKCLELRSQLAIHESELLQLKRKWELIVNHGFEKSQTSSSNSPSTLSPTAPLRSPSAPGPHATSPKSASPYFPLLPSGHPHAPVLEGIREGVQGVSRLIVAGLESIAGGPIEPSQLPHGAGGSSLHHPPLPLLLRSNSTLDRKLTTRHGQNESQSSSSTVTSASTFASEASATDTSATSRSSVSSNGSAPVTVSQTSTQVDNKQEGKHSPENREGHLKNSSPVSDRSEQVLMVCDTGATPTMSPNPDFERKRWSKRLNERQGGALTGIPDKKNTKNQEDFDPWFGDGWDELSPSPPREQPVSKPRVNIQPKRLARLEHSIQTVQSSKSPPSLPPMSTIPGLATMNLASPAAQQVSSWMGSVGKRLGEIKDSSTFTKSHKRASLLLSDMQNTLVSSLISSTPASSHFPSASATKENYPVLVPVVASNILVSQPTSSSLLDGFDDGETTGIANTDTTLLQTPVLVPSVRKSPGLSISSAILNGDQAPRLETESKGGSESDDDWNW